MTTLIEETEALSDAIESFEKALDRFMGTSTNARKPLADAHLTALCKAYWDKQTNALDHIDFARAIERAHGIGGEE